MELKDGEKTIDVCKVWEDMIREAAEKAAKEATEEATIKATKETQEETLL